MRTFRALSAACLALLAPMARAEERGPVPPGVRLSLEFDKRDYFLGENVLLRLVVSNAGTKPFHIDLGGDYRGATRHLRFKVEATDADGKPVPDPDPDQNCFGGLGHSPEIKPGEKRTETVPLLRYRRFDRPGTYRLRVSHDFGWAEKGPEPLPAAEAKITFVMPTPKQAQEVVDKTYTLPKEEADFSALMYPVYLPVLLPRARDGDVRALASIGAMPFPEATAELIRLAEHKNATFARRALQELNYRLPDPLLQKKLPLRNPFEIDFPDRRRWLVKESWRDEFAPQVRRIGRRLLAEKDAGSLSCGGYILQCLGVQEDLGVLASALGVAALSVKDQPPEQKIYPRPRGGCQELMRAAQAMTQRGIQVNEAPKTAGELLLFTTAFRSDEKFRPAGWEIALGTALGHDLPYVREMALQAAPLPPPKLIRNRLPQLVRDSNSDVQIAACHLAEKAKLPELREPVLETLRTAKDVWALRAAGNAAYSLGARLERLRALASRLDEEGELGEECLQNLTGILAGTSGWSRNQKFDAATARACKAEWERFLAQHGKAIQEGKTFQLSDPAVPLGKLFPGFKFDPKGKG